MSSRPTAVFLLVLAPVAALAQVTSGADQLPLLWVWVVAALVLLAALAWLLFPARAGARRGARRRLPVRP